MRPAVGEIRPKTLKLCRQTPNFYALVQPVSIKISSINFFAPVICLVQLNSPAVVSPRINSSTAATLSRGYLAQLLEVCGTVNHNGAEINKAQVFTLIKHYDMVQESSTYRLKTAPTVIENLNTLNEHHLLIFCKRVTIIASG